MTTTCPRCGHKVPGGVEPGECCALCTTKELQDRSRQGWVVPGYNKRLDAIDRRMEIQQKVIEDLTQRMIAYSDVVIPARMPDPKPHSPNSGRVWDAIDDEWVRLAYTDMINKLAKHSGRTPYAIQLRVDKMIKGRCSR